MRIIPNHIKIENGIPIPENNPHEKHNGKGNRKKMLQEIEIGKHIQIDVSSVTDMKAERSRYTAIISKHNKRLNWKFTLKTKKEWLTIQRLK